MLSFLPKIYLRDFTYAQHIYHLFYLYKYVNILLILI